MRLFGGSRDFPNCFCALPLLRESRNNIKFQVLVFNFSITAGFLVLDRSFV